MAYEVNANGHGVSVSGGARHGAKPRRRDEPHRDSPATVAHDAHVLWIDRGKGATPRLRAHSQPLSAVPISATELDDPRRSSASPGELLAAAHCSSYAVALGELLAERAMAVAEFRVDATCHLEGGQARRRIVSVQLAVRARAPHLDRTALTAVAHDALDRCPVSNALSTASAITIDADVISA